MPSHDTFGRVFGLLAPAPLEACFAAWVQSLAATLQDAVVAVDGKAARGSHDQARDVPPRHLVSAWADEARLVLDQRGGRPVQRDHGHPGAARDAGAGGLHRDD